ncbi:ABC-F family ATP-binding cassette domain-containing protein [Candidatus Gracilibacteria bacterium]|nr:ABC-F family ATP-binding cassette domain-containing protein [Candidatus Gracilibacteria bacterium]
MKHLNIHIEVFEKNDTKILGKIDTIINQTDRIALIGDNGTGKSTFIKILSGVIKEYEGNIENIGKMTLGYLEQIHFSDTTISIREELKNAFKEIRETEKKLKIAEENMLESGEYEEYSELQDRYNLLGGYTYENDVEKVARGIGIFHLLENTLDSVSGGERTKVALAKILLSKPDFLLLDEPTNFIDLPSVEWLEKYLIETWKGGYLIVSHDREFLDETCSNVFDMLGPNGIKKYSGGYSAAIQEKRKSQENTEKKYEEQQTMIESEKKLINRFRAGSRASFAKSRERALEKIELIEKPKKKRHILFNFPYEKNTPESIINIESAFIGRYEPLFYIREVSLQKGDRIGIVGENGVGKSTLLKTLLKKIKPLEGTVHMHENAKVLYFSQMHESLDTNETIAKNFELHGLQYTPQRIGSIIEQYGFEFNDTTKKISALSGGERSRLLFALLSQNARATRQEIDPRTGKIRPEVEEKSNILILDEPTNHLDASTRENLEFALSSYPGAILFISHDRYFVNKLAKKLWIIQDGELSISYGNYDDYQFKKERGLELDMSLFDMDGQMDLLLEEKLGASEARRIKEKFARKKARRKR